MKQSSFVVHTLLAVSVTAGLLLLLPDSGTREQQGTGSIAAVGAAMTPPTPPPRRQQQSPPPRLLSMWEEANGYYKNALLATSMGNSMDGQTFLVRFRRAWDAFRVMHADNPPPPFSRDAKRWRADLYEIAAWIDAADKELAVGETHAAHETLEQVRLRWLSMRARYGIETFGDHLTRFHEPMEQVALAVKGKTAQTLEEADVAAIRAAVPELRRLLAPIQAWAAKPEGLAHGRAGIRQEKVAVLTRAVTALEQALASADRAAIVAAGASVKPVFTLLYIEFG